MYTYSAKKEEAESLRDNLLEYSKNAKQYILSRIEI